ncbi:hypothetical protein VitviT2T_001319, partial [Vitis vinifera]
TNTDAGFASTRRGSCPANNGDGDENLAALDLVTPNSFDNNYFKNLIQKKGLLQSDQVLFSGGCADSIVTGYSKSPSTFTLILHQPWLRWETLNLSLALLERYENSAVL